MMTLLLALLAGQSQAQTTTGFDAHGFQLAAFDADPRDNFTLARPGTAETGWFAGGLLEYASRPLIFDDGTGREAVLEDVVALDLSVGVVAHERLRLDVFAPIYAASSQGGSFGDIRLSALVPVLTPDAGDGVGLGLLAFLDAPTGSPDQFLGLSGIGGGFGVAGTLERDKATLTANFGVRAAPNSAPDERPIESLGGDAVFMGVGGSYLLNPMTSLQAELRTDLELSPVIRQALGTGSELTLGARRVQPSGGHFIAGLGIGIGPGAGVTPVRLLIGGGFGSSPNVASQDLDGDGILDQADSCVDQPETVNGFDDQDGCPDEAPDLRVVATYEDEGAPNAEIRITSGEGDLQGTGEVLVPAGGSPLSAEAEVAPCLEGRVEAAEPNEDGVVVIPLNRVEGTVDITVTTADGEALSGYTVRYSHEHPRCAPKKTTFEGDNSSQGVGTGKAEIIVLADGYKTYRADIEIVNGEALPVDIELQSSKVRKTDDAIEILDKVYFETGNAAILARSNELLEDVASVINDYDIQAVEVQGHTDNVGAESMNQRLSQERAESVRDFLIDAGVPEDRLTPLGYGESTPVASNDTEDGRSQNRRVEFKIAEAEAE